MLETHCMFCHLPGDKDAYPLQSIRYHEKCYASYVSTFRPEEPRCCLNCSANPESTSGIEFFGAMRSIHTWFCRLCWHKLGGGEVVRLKGWCYAYAF